MKKQDEGFTLIELLIVIVILGILATVVVFAVGGITDQGEQSACKAERKTVEVAIEAYRAQEGSYPATMGALVGTTGFMRSTPTWYELSGTSGAIAVTTAGTAQGCTL